MILYPIQEEADAFIEALHHRGDDGQEDRFRDPGFHTSGLLHSIMNRANLTPKNSFGNQDKFLRFEMGYAWEDIVGFYYFNRLGVRPKRLETEKKDDIFYSADGFDGELVYEEKATWKSMRTHAAQSEWSWMNQIKAYCYALGVREARLRVLYVCGDYKPPAPQVMIYGLDFTQEELDKAWDMLIQEKQRLINEGYDRI